MTPKQFANAVELALMPLADDAKAQRMKAYLLNQFEFLGLGSARAPRSGQRNWQSEVAKLS